MRPCGGLRGTHYSYDIHGNVRTLLQEIKDLEPFGQSFKKIEYEYDLLSGNVRKVHYQDGQWDEFHHSYRYDADNRLLEVRTSRDGILWELDARQFYYAMGPLARTEIGRKQVQGLDNTYTLQGWLRGVNAVSLDPAHDPGKDGAQTGLDRFFARDAMAFALNYHAGDYLPVGGTNAMAHIAEANGTYGAAMQNNDLYNGNIPSMMTALRGEFGDVLDLHANVYRYDRLNRLKEQRVFHGTPLSPGGGAPIQLGPLQDNGDYANTLIYDPNGNIEKQVVYGRASASETNVQLMDDLDYHYYHGTNKLNYVHDSQVNSAYTNDLDPQTEGNYSYYGNGNLEQDLSAGINEIIWNLQNKVRHVIRGDQNLPNLEFRYGPMGQRTVKIVKPQTMGGPTFERSWTITYYILDANGNPMAIYTRRTEDPDQGSNAFKDVLRLEEFPIYGSSRLGLVKEERQKVKLFTYTQTTSTAISR